jgi:type VI protein secretion system component VasF
MSKPEKPPAETAPTPGPATAADPHAGEHEIAEAEASTKALFKDLGLNKVSAPPDLSAKVPQLIERRSKGRFFGRKPLSERLPLEWLSIAMLALLALLYALMRLSPALLGQP